MAPKVLGDGCRDVKRQDTFLLEKVDGFSGASYKGWYLGGFTVLESCIGKGFSQNLFCTAVINTLMA